MSDINEDVSLSLKVMINKERSKVLFAVADNHFVDILLSFLSMPLGRILKALEKQYEDEAPTIGSLSNLYRSLSILDGAHFWTEDAKKTLLNPTSLFEDEYKRLKLDITDSPSLVYFSCSWCVNRFRSISIYYDGMDSCNSCRSRSNMLKEVVATKGRVAASSDGVLTIQKSSFTISDDLQIFPNEIGLLQIITELGITDSHNAEEIQVSFGFTEIMKLLKALLTSPTPLSDVILNKTTWMNSGITESQPKIETEENPNSKNLSLKVMIQKSSGKLIYAQAKEDFIEFLFSLFLIPLGGAVHLVGGKSYCKPINNLYRSTTDRVHEYFKSPDTKNKLINPILPHGCISKNQILPLLEEGLPAIYTDNLSLFSSTKFPKGKGTYLLGQHTYKVTDDLTVAPFCAVSVLSSLNSLKISISDIEEVELPIGLKEALSILKASLTSTSILSDALLNLTSNKQPKREV